MRFVGRAHRAFDFVKATRTTHPHTAVLLIFVAMFFWCTKARAQSNLPDSPNASLAITQPVEGISTTHTFWDKQNVLLFSGIAVFRGLDYASTRNMQARGREEILIPDDVVNNSAGFAALEAAATATSVGISYIFHRTGHHKLERWMSIGHISVTAFGVARNYALKSKHP
jgi:hypothetical protein